MNKQASRSPARAARSVEEERCASLAEIWGLIRPEELFTDACANVQFVEAKEGRCRDLATLKACEGHKAAKHHYFWAPTLNPAFESHVENVKAGGEFSFVIDISTCMMTPDRAHKLVKRGIPSKAVEPLGDYLGLGKGVVAEYLDLDRATASRRAAENKPLPLHASESFLRILELDQMANDTFASQAEANEWLRRPHPMLGGETPLECAKTSFGAQSVKDLLVSLKYGGVV